MAVKSTITLDLFLKWLPLAFIITMLSGLIYVSVQQVYRQSANDPQIEFAENISGEFAKGHSPEYLRDESQIDIGKSLSPFIQVYDDKKKLIVSTAMIGKNEPNVPAGVLENARKMGQNRITWQPTLLIRTAIVVNYYEAKTSSGYVVVGRSLREVERRDDQLTKSVFAVWMATLVGSFLFLHKQR